MSLRNILSSSLGDNEHRVLENTWAYLMVLFQHFLTYGPKAYGTAQFGREEKWETI